MPRFAIGQYVELLPTIPSSRGGELLGGTRGIVREVGDGGSDSIYRVAFLRNELPSDDIEWVDERDLLAA